MTASPSRLPAAALAVLLAAGLGAEAAVALEPSRLPSQYIHHSWSEELPQSHVQAVLQDARGFLWLATQEGLVRFDGREWTVYGPSNTEALRQGNVRALHEDALGRLWIGTRGGGLLVSERGSFRRPEGATEALGEASLVQALAEDAEGLWVGTRDHGLARFAEGAWSVLGAEEGLPDDGVLALLASEGTLWVGTRAHGLFRRAGGRFEPVELVPDEPVTVLTLAKDRAGSLWVGTRAHGLFRLDSEEVTTYTAGPGPPGNSLPSDSVTALLEDRHGNLWVGTYGGGLGRLTAGSWSVFTSAEGLTSDLVLALLEDREGSLWIGTEGGGLNRLMDGSFVPLGTPEGLGADYVWAVLEDREGSLWIGTEGGGLGRWQAAAGADGSLTNLTVRDGLSSDSVTALYEDRAGSLWVGTRGGGLDRLQDGRPAAHFGPGEGLASDTVLALAEDAAGTLWAGTRGGGIHRFNGTGFVRDLRDDALAETTVLALAPGRHGLLVGTNGLGLVIVAGEGARTLGLSEGLAHGTVLALHVEARDGDSGETVWIGTAGGLNRLRLPLGPSSPPTPGELATVTTAQGLPSDVVYRILDDGRGSLWMSCNRGIFAVEREALEAVADGRSESVEIRTFGRRDGMRSAECNGGGQPAGSRTRDGRLWFPTVAGAVAVDPGRLRSNPVAPGLVLERVVLDGKPVDPESAPVLPPAPERVEFHWAATSFRAPESVVFRHRLEGFDAGWIDAGTDRHATYTNLPTGRRYRFRVIAANEDGVWNDEGASFGFSIERHFYETPAFFAAAAVALALAGWGLYQLRVRQLVARSRRLEAVIAERTAEVVAQKESLEAANRELERLNQIKSEFLAIAAHDIKNPLSVIYGHADHIAQKARGAAGSEGSPGSSTTGDSSGGELRRVAKAMSASVRTILNIVSDLLDTTAIESGKLTLDRRPCDLEERVLEALARNAILAAERRIRLHYEPGEDDPPEPLSLDQERIDRVLDNLLSNAVKYSPEGSTVKVRLRPAGEWLRLEVEDEGPGVSEEARRRIFERFERLAGQPRSRAPSTGLGLSIVKQFAELHGGRVTVESEPGAGSTFVVELPV